MRFTARSVTCRLCEGGPEAGLLSGSAGAVLAPCAGFDSIDTKFDIASFLP
jgi:hypothetical protein